MPIDIARALDSLRSFSMPDGPWPAGAPPHELTRSPASARVGRLAADAGLFLFHFEHRAHLSLPEAWSSDEDDDLDAPQWSGGVLPERKYQSFRHDLAIGSFHPGHRAKWTTHELCHGLVGFAWRPDATPLFHATASRLAELLPVALWYFLDEIGLQRCPVHTGGGALFRAFCPACEEAAAAGALSVGADAEGYLVGAKRFLDRELAAVAQTRRLGRPVPHKWVTLDLCSDGIAYASAHGRRLQSEAFERLAAGFLVDGGGVWSSLDALEARVVELARALAEGAPAAPLAAGPEAGRKRWIRQDVAWRLLQVWEDTGGAARDALEAMVDRLAAPDGAIADAIRDYRDLHDEYDVPAPAEVFATGYDLPDGLGRSHAQLRDGLSSVTPLVAHLLGDALPARVVELAASDPPTRTALAERWVATLPGPLADLGRYEHAIRSVRFDAQSDVLGPDGADASVRLAPGVRVLQLQLDPRALAERVDAGSIVWDDGVLVAVDDTEPWAAEPVGLVVSADHHGVIVTEVPYELAGALGALGDGAVATIPPEDEAWLRDIGVLIPASWAL